MTALLSARGVVKSYGRTRALRGVTLAVEAGEIVAVTGPSGCGKLSFLAGRVLHRFGRGPAALLAARRLMADPWAGSRTFAALLACVICGAGAVQFRAWLHALVDDYDESDKDFYFGSLDLVDAAVAVGVAIAAAGLLVALAEGIVARRRTYAALVAAGVPRTTLARSILWQVFAPLVPAVLLALTVGLSLVRGLSGVDATLSIDIPFAGLAAVGGIALGAALLMVGVGLLFLRSSTSLEELRTG